MKKIYYIFAVLLIFMSACKKEASIKGEQLETPGKTITYHLKNGGEVTVAINSKGEYVVGGDVILSKDQIAYLEYNKVASDKTSTPRSTFTTTFQKLWPGGVVYYTISNTINSSNIGLAINEWESNTSIRFIQRTNQTNYVDFSNAPTQGSGSSQLGMIGGRQEIKLENNASFSTVVHEIGHAVGLMHEQTRSDRDQYINVNYGNINNDWKSQYNIYNLGAGYQTGTFDFNSVMLYRSDNEDARINGNTAPQMTRKNGSTWGDNYYLSQGDIDGVDYMYNPKVFIKVVSNYNENESFNNSQGGNDDVKIVYDMSLELYSNYELTVPFTSPIPVAINLSYYYNDNNVKAQIIVPPGTQSLFYGQNIEEYYMEYGQYRYHNNYTVFPEKGVGYIVPGP
jgi:hypothetical protein